MSNKKQEESKVIDTEEIYRKLKALEEIKPMSKNQIIGFLSIQLNEWIQKKVANTLHYRIALEAKIKYKDDEVKQTNLMGAEAKILGWLQENDEQIKIFRDLIRDIEKGKLEI